jgi:hypothetical protein
MMMMMMMTTTTIQFFVYLRAELNSQWPITVSTNTNNSSRTTQDKINNKTKKNGSTKAFHTHMIY